ncbi:DUF3300 domain-containing protein [Paraburkholderia humisilvae]|uniref:DUF3300 domain-containing protein n=1 Tax=Paraburkholderia humisilvae TaxID=627669 RepID=A0A6J5EPV5_9BURK|nr:DUF3300 domain-containing protein [Paraburkholderia humisilvae]CAB3768489.1 hypothetical protein LMG29542_05867 [Paraburkholderia humisilvae]
MSSHNERWARAVRMWLLVMLTSAAGFTHAQTEPAQPQPAQPAQPAPSAQPNQPVPFKPEEIEALVAPIALYPDSVLSQVLMASTYPLEIVHAARWAKANPKLKGDAAVKAVENEPWDVSVKSLVAFPQILEPMNDKLDWTQKLGDAFLAQEKDVFAAIQRLRARAQEAGNLKSTEQQKVVVEQAPPPAGGGQPPTQTIVRIEPANPEVIYVPAYNPTVVYGAWSYPTYPPYYWPPPPAYYPGAALATGFAWGIGLAAAGAIFSDCNWGGGDVNINVNKAANIDRNFDRTKVQGNGNRWQHDGSHRQGVAYRDNATRNKYAGNVPGAEGRSDFRGRNNGTNQRASVADRAGTGNRAATADRAGAGNRAATADRGNAGNRATTADRGNAGNRATTADRGGAGNRATTADRSNLNDRGGASNRGGAGAGNFNRASDQVGGGGFGGGGGGGRDNAFQGVGAGGATQRSADRGRSSMQGSGFNRPSGGGMRGGGGGARGGRR